MPTMNDAYISALLADASYVDGLADGLPADQLRNRLQTRMTRPLAEFISSAFTVVTHIETGDGPVASGFDATVWRRNSDGAIFVSMQGTQGFADFLADVDLTALGAARAAG
jgi:hypothetical protein